MNRSRTSLCELPISRVCQGSLFCFEHKNRGIADSRIHLILILKLYKIRDCFDWKKLRMVAHLYLEVIDICHAILRLLSSNILKIPPLPNSLIVLKNHMKRRWFCFFAVAIVFSFICSMMSHEPLCIRLKCKITLSAKMDGMYKSNYRKCPQKFIYKYATRQ